MILGQALPQNAPVHIVTKLPPGIAGQADPYSASLQAVQSALADLRCTSLYGVLVHRSEDYSPSVAAALKQLRDEGLVQHIGASIYGPEELPALVAAGISLVQAPFSLLDQRMLRSGWFTRLAQAGIPVHTRSTLLQGLLLARHGHFPLALANGEQLLRTFWADCDAQRISPLSAAIHFCLGQADVEAVVVGITNVPELEQLITALEQTDRLRESRRYACDDLDFINPSRWPVGWKLTAAEIPRPQTA
jgi:aryl-alcohol dehydrogenase-like predicted oxidoreductase